MPKLILNSIPSELQAIPHWLAWKYVTRDGKTTKMPVQLRTENPASCTDPTTWLDWPAVKKYGKGFKDEGGVGFVVTSELGIVGIDLDHAVELGVPLPWAAEIIADLDSYTEISPSGTGVRIWAYGRICGQRRKASNIEMYTDGRFLTVTGDRIGANEQIQERQEQIDNLYHATFPKDEPTPRPPRVVDLDIISDDQILQKAFSAKNGAAIELLFRGDTTHHASDDSVADMALCSHLAFYAGPNGQDTVDALFRQSGLMREKWDRPTGSSTYGLRTILGVYSKMTQFYETSDYVNLENNRQGVDAVNKVSTGSVDTLEPNTGYISNQNETITDETREIRQGVDAVDAFDITLDSDWPGIVEMRDVPSEYFPVEALPPVISRFVSEVARVIQVPVDMPGLAAISLLAYCASRHYEIRVSPGWTEHTLSLYTAIVAEPGTRKSACLEVMAQPLLQAEIEMSRNESPEISARREHRGAQEKYLDRKRAALGKEETAEERQRLASEIAKEADALPEVPPAPRVLAEDITQEKLINLLQEQNGTMCLISSEGGIFNILAGRYSNGESNLDIFLKGHDGEPYRVDRMNRSPEFIPSCRLGICLMVQPDVMTSLASKKEFRGRGFLGRFLFSLPRDNRGERMIDATAAGINPEYRDDYEQALKSLILKRNDCADPFERHTLKFSASALAYHIECSNEIERRLGNEEELRAFADWAAKLSGRIARIAGALHTLLCQGEPHESLIPLSTVERAWEFAEYFIAHALPAFGLMRMNATLESSSRLLAWLKKQPDTEVTLRNAQRYLHRHSTKEELEKAFKLLADHYYIRAIDRKNQSGLVTRTYRKHPDLRTQK